MNRECNGCTKCCEGWLEGQVNGYAFWRGRPCHFKTTNGCAIYKDRPEDPCKSFSCEWLINDKIPEWVKPDMSGVIIQHRQYNNTRFIHLTEAGNKLPVEVLSWAIMYCSNEGLNLLYTIDGGFNRLGNAEFLQADIQSLLNAPRVTKDNR